MLGIRSLIKESLNHVSIRCEKHYTQGQSSRKGGREYFYYIDHQGMLFLDDARIKNFTSCFKEIKFLSFFFDNLRLNETGFHQEEFPYLSPCGREKNYIRCEDLPIVFTSLQTVNGKQVLPYNHCGPKHIVDFQPQKLYMSTNGRVYHPGPDKLHGVGLIKSQLAVELSEGFIFGLDGKPSWFIIKDFKYKLDNSLKKNLDELGRKD